MSYDILALRLPDEDGAARVGDREAVVRELGGHRYELADDGWVNLRTPDGGRADSDFGLDDAGRFTGMSHHVHSLTPQLADLIYATARAAGMFLVAPAHEGAWLVTDEAQLAELPPDDDEWERIVLDSGAELLTVCTDGYEAWRRYRDTVVDRRTQPD